MFGYFGRPEQPKIATRRTPAFAAARTEEGGAATMLASAAGPVKGGQGSTSRTRA